MTMKLSYHLGDLFQRLPLLDVLHDHLVKHLLLDVLHDQLTTSSSTSSFPSSLSSCKSKKPRKVRQKKKENMGGGNCPPGKCTFFGDGKYPNLGVANVRYMGMANVRLANDLPTYCQTILRTTLPWRLDALSQPLFGRAPYYELRYESALCNFVKVRLD